MEDEVAFHVQAPRFALALSSCECWACGQTTRVARLVIGPGQRGEGDGDAEVDEDPSEITYVGSLNAEALEAVQRLAPWMRWLASNTMGSTYLGNSCESCGALQGEHFLGKPGGPFFPTDEEWARAISLTWIELPFEAQVEGQSMGVVWMRSASVRKQRKPRVSKRGGKA